MERQKYYLSDNKMEIDTVCNLVYQVRNVSSTSQVVMFTEDDVNSMPLKTLIKRKLIRRYGDFSISFFLWDGNVVNNSAYVNVPGYFIKILPPNESLSITLTLQNEDDCLVDSLFRNHILICNLEDIEGDERFCGFENAMNLYHLLYPYSSVTLLWSQFALWLNNQNQLNLQNQQNSANICVFDEFKKDNPMINKDGSYNSYLFVDTLHFENEGLILSRHDGHYYLFSDSSEIHNVKNFNNIIRENNVYIYQPDFIDYLCISFSSDYLWNLILRMHDPGSIIYPETEYKTKHYFKMKFKKKPTGYYLCLVKGSVYNYLTYVRSADVYNHPLKFPDDNAFYKLVIPYW